MENLKNEIRRSLIELALQMTEETKVGHLQLWSLINNHFELKHVLNNLENGLNNELKKGYSIDDLEVGAKYSAQPCRWFDYIYLTLRNKMSDRVYNEGDRISFTKSKGNLTKSELLEVLELEQAKNVYAYFISKYVL